MKDALKNYLNHDILKIYESFDDAHQPDHVRRVIAESLLIAEDYDLDNDMVETIAYFHDIGMLEGRKNHHLSGARRLAEDLVLRDYFSAMEITMMKEAIEDHRASNSTPPRSLYGKIIAEADRDLDPDCVIRRTIQFGLHHYPDLSSDDHVKRAYEHLTDKYGEDGYLMLWLNTGTNARGLKELRRLIGNKEELIRLIEDHYQAIKKR